MDERGRWLPLRAFLALSRSERVSAPIRFPCVVAHLQAMFSPRACGSAVTLSLDLCVSDFARLTVAAYGDGPVLALIQYISDSRSQIDRIDPKVEA